MHAYVRTWTHTYPKAHIIYIRHVSVARTGLGASLGIHIHILADCTLNCQRQRERWHGHRSKLATLNDTSTYISTCATCAPVAKACKFGRKYYWSLGKTVKNASLTNGDLRLTKAAHQLHNFGNNCPTVRRSLFGADNLWYTVPASFIWSHLRFIQNAPLWFVSTNRRWFYRLVLCLSCQRVLWHRRRTHSEREAISLSVHLTPTESEDIRKASSVPSGYTFAFCVWSALFCISFVIHSDLNKTHWYVHV